MSRNESWPVVSGGPPSRETNSGRATGRLRWGIVAGAVLVVLVVAVSGGWRWYAGRTATPDDAPRIATTCRTPDGGCVYVRQATDPSDGAPLPRSSVILLFTAPVWVPDERPALVAMTPAIDLETGAPGERIVPVRSVVADAGNPRQVVVEVDGLLADGATLELPDGVLHDRAGAGFGPVRVAVRTPFTPFEAALAGMVWEPADRSLFSNGGLTRPRGATGDAAVQQELEARLRIRPGIGDEQVQAVLARYDSPAVKAKVPDHRVRAGLLLLTGTSGEHSIDYLLSDTNRTGLVFAPIEVGPIADFGVWAAVFNITIAGESGLYMIVDSEIAAESLENIAVVLAHEIVHSSGGGASATQEALAMALNTRVYEELILFDPTIVESPTEFTKVQNRLTLALRNSGRFGYPKAGILPRPGVEDALRGTEDLPVSSFKDFLFHPDNYGGLRRAGDVGSDVLEAYYRRLSGDWGNRGRIPFNDQTLKLFDEVIDNGFTPEQVLAITGALRLRAVPAAMPDP